jgi:hypothetical protein
MAKIERGRMVKAGKNSTGLYFRLNKAGEKTFYIVFRDGGKVVWEKVGSKSADFSSQYAHQARKDKLVELGQGVSRSTLTLDAAFKKYHMASNVENSGEYVSKVLGAYNLWLKPRYLQF